MCKIFPKITKKKATNRSSDKKNLHKMERKSSRIENKYSKCFN